MNNAVVVNYESLKECMFAVKKAEEEWFAKPVHERIAIEQKAAEDQWSRGIGLAIGELMRHGASYDACVGFVEDTLGCKVKREPPPPMPDKTVLFIANQGYLCGGKR